MAILAECTLILAWSPEEAGRYLETYKSYEHKPIDALKERIEQDFVSQVSLRRYYHPPPPLSISI